MEVYTENFLSSCRNPQTQSVLETILCEFSPVAHNQWSGTGRASLVTQRLLGAGHEAPPGSAASRLGSVLCLGGPFWSHSRGRGAEGMAGAGVYLWGPSPLCLLLGPGTDLTCSKRLRHPAGCVRPRCHGINQNFIKPGLSGILLGRKPISSVCFFFFSPPPFPSVGLMWGGYEEGNTDQ